MNLRVDGVWVKQLEVGMMERGSDALERARVGWLY